MKRIIVSFAIILSFLIGIMPNCFADGEMSLNIAMSYDSEEVTISGTTPALYGQKISVVIYRPQTAVSSLAEIENRENPEEVLPLNNLLQIVRMNDVIADYSGAFGPIMFSLSGLEKGFYIVSVAGNGYKSDISKASDVIYFETQDDINTETLREINDADAAGIDRLIRQKEMLFGISVDDDYEANLSTVTNLFVSIRKNDFGGKYDSMSQVQDTFGTISVLRSLYAVRTISEAQSICEENATLLGIKPYLSSTDYAGYEETVYKHLLHIIANDKPESATELKNQFLQSMGLAALNRKNASNITESIQTYGEVLGLSLSEYEKACKKYGTSEINKAFVGRDFTNPEQAVAAFKSRLDNLSETEKTSSGTKSSGGSTRSVDSSLVTPAEPKLSAQKFGDVPEGHWSYTAVQSLAEMGVILGNENGSFEPDGYVSREQFTKMLVLALKLYDENAAADFSDVEETRWSKQYIASAAARKIVNGYYDETFHPSEQIIRQDAAVMIYRACSVKNIKLSANEESSFADGDSISDYAKESVLSLSGAGVISGFTDGSFSPFGTLTRAQAAKLIYELILR